MKPVVIFGIGAFAEILHFYFTHDTDRKVVAFTVDPTYLKESTFCGLPVVSYEEVTKLYPPESFDMCLAIGHQKKGRFIDIVEARKKKYEDALAKGYDLVTYISSKAHVWHPHLIGKNCIIMEGNTIQPFVKIGNNVTIFPGSNFGHHAVIEDHVFIAGMSAISGHTVTGEGSFISIGTVLRNGITLGKRAFIGVGAVVTNDVNDEEVYTSEPAKLRRIKSTKIHT